MQVETYKVGKNHSKSLMLIYHEKRVAPRLLHSVQQKIKAGQDQEVQHISFRDDFA